MHYALKVTILQTDIKWADPDANQKALESALLSSEKSDLYVLPEMWDTGFIAEANENQNENENENEKFSIINCQLSINLMQQLARRFDAAIAGSMAVRQPTSNSNHLPSGKTGGGLYNRFYFVTPTDTFYYDKRHLFSYAGEDKSYTAGGERTVVEWRGMRFLLQVCYDLRFPCFSRNRLLPSPSHLSPLLPSGRSGGGSPLYDAIIYVANWPASRRRAWDVLLQARALENQCFVIGVNRVGDDPHCHYDGGSAIIDAKGRILATVKDDTAAAATALLDMESLNAFREKFPVLRDADG